jgi:hypothetical protein
VLVFVSNFSYIIKKSNKHFFSDKMTTTTFALLLPCLLQVWMESGVTVDCNADGPENCTFQSDVNLYERSAAFITCSWSMEGGWWGSNRGAVTWQKHLALGWSDESGQLTSRASCSTQGNMSCLTFNYKFLGESDKLELNVYIKNVLNATRNLKIWSASKGSFVGYFETARVDVQLNYVRFLHRL